MQALLDCKDENGGVPISIHDVAAMRIELQALKDKGKMSKDDYDNEDECDIVDEPPEFDGYE